MVDWELFVKRLQPGFDYSHQLHPPCPAERIGQINRELGALPTEVDNMLRIFNGGEIFVNPMPSVTIFGLSLPGDRRDFDWFIDRYTPAWRSAKNRPQDWILAMTSYGGLLVMEQDLTVRQWDTARHAWDGLPMSYEDWLDATVRECNISVNELRRDRTK
jgi:hypothetical protein